MQVVDLRIILQSPGSWSDLATILNQKITAKTGILRMQIGDDVTYYSSPVSKTDLKEEFLREFATGFFKFGTLHNYQDMIFISFIEI